MTTVVRSGPWGGAQDLNLDAMKHLITPQIKARFGSINPLVPNGKIWVGAQPWDDGVAHLINDLGIRTFVSLHEKSYHNLAERIFMEKKVTYSLLHFPIRDFGTAKDDDILEFVEKLIKQLKKGEMLPMYIHCHAGLGRTGTIASLVLSYLYGIDADQAMSRVTEFKNLRTDCFGGSSPETYQQKEQVRRLAPILKERLESIQIDDREEDVDTSLNRTNYGAMIDADLEKGGARDEIEEDNEVVCCSGCIVQ